ncbi:hypothetical protein [Paenibacillus naphthalenovorans]|uniref:Bacterial Ig-like domain-containing protein n=1 Tax=Paenibacillus naphthalenovorans TaxID=162209 RepID=A0A0U2KZ62_9BACL|nr:hypothetical protein [Paenibacillus naphthalenovorans]ALS22306.1 bacterial Ig-like domain-containing protein [Paenibacillus naphthalenovorans]
MNISNINKYKKYVENGTYQNKTLQKLAERYSNQYHSTISHLDIIIHSDRANTIIKNGLEYKCIVDYGNLPKKSALSNIQLVFYREVITKHEDNIRAGDIVEFAFNNEARKTYLFLKTIEIREDGYDLSIMQECNAELKWIDDNGNIQIFPCIFFSNSRSNFGISSDKLMMLPNGRRQVIVQRNEHTVKFKRHMRFMFGGSVFKVIDFDAISDDGIVNLNMQDDLFNPATDNEDLGIADYRESNYSLKILNDNNISVELNQTLQLSVEALKNNTPVNINEITFVSDNPNVGIIDNSGLFTPVSIGSTLITAEYKGITSSIVIFVRDIQYNNYTVDLEGNDSIYYNKSSKYTPIFKNNGHVIDEQATFYITADDGFSPTNLATLSSQVSNECVILAGNKTGYIRLHVNSMNGLISGHKRIYIKSYT